MRPVNASMHPRHQATPSTPASPKACASGSSACLLVRRQTIIVLILALRVRAIIAVLAARLGLPLASSRICAHAGIVLRRTCVLARLWDRCSPVARALGRVLGGVKLEGKGAKGGGHVVACQRRGLDATDTGTVGVPRVSAAIGKNAHAANGGNRNGGDRGSTGGCSRGGNANAGGCGGGTA